jgi:hypothetical protein
MQTFLRHGDAYTQVTADAIRLSAQKINYQSYQSPIQTYDHILTKLGALQTMDPGLASVDHFTDNLHVEATLLVQSIAQLQSGDPELSSVVLRVFSACLPILEARIDNLSCAHELVQSTKENMALELEMESLRITT